MNRVSLEALLKDLVEGKTDIQAVVRELRNLPLSQEQEFTLDSHRELRCGFPEVIFGQSKTSAQISAIVSSMMERGSQVLVTRVTAEKVQAVRKVAPRVEYYQEAEILFVAGRESPPPTETVLVISAGTSDQRVAEEAAVTAELMGAPVIRLRDMGVAGLQRILAHQQGLRSAAALVVVAGMEGALPSVVAGLTDRPVIAVPTSVGYGANLGGFTTLLAMLSSCASGVTVVNIDNGFGAGYAAVQIARVGVSGE